jgi:glycosyltransferase involved in cell wall biosynthesis
MLLLDLSHTAHTRARTGIQRVARALSQNLGPEALPVTHDPFLRAWRALEPWEIACLSNSRGGKKRRARWPAIARWRGRCRRMAGRTGAHGLRGEFSGVIVPEIFSPVIARGFPDLFSRVRGPRIALFLDAIPLRFPEFTPPATVARFPGYMQELLMFDGIAAISEESRESLSGYWRWLGIRHPPPVAAIPLGVDPAASSFVPGIAVSGRIPVVLAVGTLEGRKNHLTLLNACEQLWASGSAFELRLIGHVNAETGGAALARVRALQAANRPLRYDGPASDGEIAQAYAACAFTVYPSIAEGFGLPVIESLTHGKPCICSARGALGESARGGGCLALDSVDAASLGAAIARLLEAPAELAALSAAARARSFRSWADYTRELTTWMHDLPRR